MPFAPHAPRERGDSIFGAWFFELLWMLDVGACVFFGGDWLTFPFSPSEGERAGATGLFSRSTGLIPARCTTTPVSLACRAIARDAFAVVQCAICRPAPDSSQMASKRT